MIDGDSRKRKRFYSALTCPVCLSLVLSASLCLTLALCVQTCGSSNFASRFSLERHMKVHTGERPHKCQHPGCGMAFAEKSTLRVRFSVFFFFAFCVWFFIVFVVSATR